MREFGKEMFPSTSKQTGDEEQGNIGQLREPQHRYTSSNVMDSIVVTRLRGSSTPPPLPPAYVHSPMSPHSHLPPPSPLARSCPRPPNISLPSEPSSVCPTPLHRAPGSSRTPTPTRMQPRTPSLPSPSLLSGPWHGRYSAESPHGYHQDVTPSPLNSVSSYRSVHEGEELVLPPRTEADGRALTRRYTFPRFGTESKQALDSLEANEKMESAPSTPASSTHVSVFDPVQNVQSLEEAVSLGEPALVEWFLKRGDGPDGDEDCKSPPLIVAAALGSEKIVKLLLTAGANINRRDLNQCTALHHAAAGGHRGVVKLLLVAGVDMFAKTPEGLLPVEVTHDRRIHNLLTCRMSLGHMSPRKAGELLSLSGKECIPEEHLSLSSEGFGLESPTTASSLSVQNSSFQCLPMETLQLQHQENSSQTPTSNASAVKFVPPSDEDLSLIRKDWHEAARSGCIGCGKEACGGTCLPSQAKPSSEVEKPTPTEMTLKDGSFVWTRGELLGEGAYGKVFAGLNQSTGELMAVKQLKIEPSEGQTKTAYLASLKREIDLYKQLRHKHIVGYIAMEQDEVNNSLYIFLEYVSGGSIQSMLERFGRFSEPLVRVYTRQLLMGLEYLHDNKIVHRDIKGGNILVDADGIVKLADFGASKVFHDPTITDGCKSIRGSVFWMAPEVIKGDGYGRRADIWSVGCTVIEMLTAAHPWPGIDNTWTAIFHIAKASSGPPIPEDVSECGKDFLQQCFQLDARSRPTAKQLLDHPFVTIDVK